MAGTHLTERPHAMKVNLYRPIFHFMPPQKWMNDPNGPIFYDGEYHLFYQHNPYDSKWGCIHWGHASSKDLVHWRHWPIALHPSTELGEVHCFSGCTVVHDDVPTIIYTSVGEGPRHQSVGAEQWMAISTDGMRTWQKYEGNPILKGSVHGDMVVREWRDPFVWYENGAWYMVLGGRHDDKGCALLYRSKDLVNWEFLNKLLEGPDETWECPNLFRLGNRHVLVYSPCGPVRYHVGTLEPDFTFRVEHSGWIDHAGWDGYYAPNSMCDPKGRRIMWGWLPENSRGDFLHDCDWAGVMSIPRVLTLDADLHLEMRPTEELAALRREHWHVQDVQVEGDWIAGMKGRALEIIVQVELPDEDVPIHVKVLRSWHAEEETIVVLNPRERAIAIDRSKSTLSSLPSRTVVKGTLQTDWRAVQTLHIFVDHSVIEAFFNYRECISTRVYPTREDSVHVAVSAPQGRAVRIKSMDIWALASIWDDQEG